ncbi:MAG: 23S rRNA (adenine(2503)-C(2))-methyltransferase RlmN [Lachnospiraceae bacterium]|nr:23S rRNA (adenine(2503)-C(2))-methyltransferase RlmN [Lachnospiraceae bacterium]
MDFSFQSSEKIDIRSLTSEKLLEMALQMGQPKYRAGQLFAWLHNKCVNSFDEMSNLPASFREELKGKCVIRNLEQVRVQVSKADGTRKYLFKLFDDNLIESVMMRYKHGNSVCVSSQVGCAMGCSFCASTLGGLVRNLSAGEILGQIYEIQKETGERVSNVVVMGMGEPMANYGNVMDFVRILSDENSLHISQRNITISTCGLVPQIIALSNEGLKITLALSLHAPNDEIRRRIMPIANKYSIDEILDACRTYFDNTGRRVTFEYCLIDGVNDLPAHARELAGRLKGMNAHVNLIPVNPTPENNYGQAKEKDIQVFKDILEEGGITTTRRREMGRDISGACGQLRQQTLKGL